MSLLRDEQGGFSMARCSLAATLMVTLPCIVADAASRVFNVPPAAYSLLGSMLLAFASWAAGPRIAQYIGPQIGAVAGAIGKAKGDSEMPDRFRDDETGP